MPLGEYTLLVVVLAALGLVVLRTASPMPPEGRLLGRDPAGRRLPPALPGQSRRSAFAALARERAAARPSSVAGLGVAPVGCGGPCLPPGARSPKDPAPGALASPAGPPRAVVAPILAPAGPAPTTPRSAAAAVAPSPAAARLVAFTVVVPLERLQGRRARLSLTLE